MTSTLLTRGTVIVDEALQRSATEVIKAAGDEKFIGLTLTTSTGRTVAMNPAVADLIGRILGRVAQGGELTVQTVPELLTTSAAAELLSVSRPTVMKLIRDGEIESVMAGTHHRLRFKDVSALRATREDARRDAVAQLLGLGEDDA